MSDTNPTQIHAKGEATGFIHAPGDKGKPITVIGTNSIRAGFDATCLQQALNAREDKGNQGEHAYQPGDSSLRPERNVQTFGDGPKIQTCESGIQFSDLLPEHSNQRRAIPIGSNIQNH